MRADRTERFAKKVVVKQQSGLKELKMVETGEYSMIFKMIDYSF